MSRKRIVMWVMIQLPAWVIGGYCRYAYLVPASRESTVLYVAGETLSAAIILFCYWKIIRWARMGIKIGIMVAGAYLFIDALLWPVPLINNPQAFNQANVIQLVLGMGIILIWLGEQGRRTEVSEPKK